MIMQGIAPIVIFNAVFETMVHVCYTLCFVACVLLHPVHVFEPSHSYVDEFVVLSTSSECSFTLNAASEQLACVHCFMCWNMMLTSCEGVVFFHLRRCAFITSFVTADVELNV